MPHFFFFERLSSCNFINFKERTIPMKILRSDQMYQADRATLKKQCISSLELMERAGKRCYEWILEHYGNFRKIRIYCGTGNNGGDGLVIARLLNEAGFEVELYALQFSSNSDDFQSNLALWESQDRKVHWITEEVQLPEPDSEALLIDAIFGIGLNRAPEGLIKSVIQHMNRSGATVLSVDFPSGLFSEQQVTDREAVVKADICLSFQNPKLAFFLPQNSEFIKRWALLDIGLDQQFIQDLDCDMEMIDAAYVKNIYKKRATFSHKGTYGHSLIIGGSFGKIGAVALASRAALRTGSGLVSVYIPKCGYEVLQSVNPEVMAEVDSENYLEYFNFKTRANVLAVGPGLGTHMKTKKGFVDFLKEQRLPMVLDADALNIVAEHEEIAKWIPSGSVLTPHPGEFRRLVGDWETDLEKLGKQKAYAGEHNCVVVLKGAHTSITDGGQVFFNNTGNPALATAGSGDVLTGMITGLMAQGYSGLKAAILGVYLHGRVADIGVEKGESQESFLASDCFRYMGLAFNELRSS